MSNCPMTMTAEEFERWMVEGIEPECVEFESLSPEARAGLEAGLASAKAGRVKHWDRDFTQYLDDDKRCACGEPGVWHYEPGTGDYCDNCVARGCSCNIDPHTGVEDTDENGRLLPCCEFKFFCEDDEDLKNG